MYIDSHAHLTGPGVVEEVDILLERAREVGVEAVINICTDRRSLELGVALSRQYPWVFSAAATTPHDVEKEGEELFPVMAEAAKRGLLVAVGETGLDYYYEYSNREVQRSFLRKYLQLALECRLPAVIHCRDAFDDLFEIVDSEYLVDGAHAPAVLHCFTGTMSDAKAVIERGWYLSLSGIVTFKKSEELRKVAAWVPLERLLIETDTPYLAPQSHRGKRNEPSYLPETALAIAQVKGLDVEEVAKTSTKNARQLFGL